MLIMLIFCCCCCSSKGSYRTLLHSWRWVFMDDLWSAGRRRNMTIKHHSKYSRKHYSHYSKTIQAACRCNVFSLWNKSITQQHIWEIFLHVSCFTRVVHWPRNLLSTFIGLQWLFRRLRSYRHIDTDLAVHASSMEKWCIFLIHPILFWILSSSLAAL